MIISPGKVITTVNAFVSRSVVLCAITEYNFCGGIMDYHKLSQ